MNPDRPELRPAVRRAVLMLALAAAALGCGAEDSSGNLGPPGAAGSAGTGGPSMDGGAGGAEAGGGTDGRGGAGGESGVPSFPGTDAGGFFNNPVEELLADRDRDPLGAYGDGADAGGYVDAAAVCYQTDDACESPSCAPFASCCVATGSCCAPLEQGPLPSAVDFAACAGLSLAACASSQGFEATSFGAEAPVLTDRGLVPNGSPTAEGGAFLGSAVDLGSLRVRVEATLAPPVGCGGVCLQSAGIGFSPAREDGAFAGVAAGVLRSGSREQVQVLVGGQVVASFDVGTAPEAWAIGVTPSGMLEVEREGVVQGRYSLDGLGLTRARLAVFGRNLDAGADSASVVEVTTTTERCDNPRAWSEREPLTVTVQGSPEPAFAFGREPSIATGPGSTTVAFELDGAIFVGEVTSPATVDLESDVPTVFPTEAFESGGLGDPELFRRADGLHLFYTAYDQDGVGTIGSARLDGSDVEKSPAPVLQVPGDAVSLDSPSVSVQGDLLFLVVRATLRSGATELRVYYGSDPEAGWARVLDGGLEALTRVIGPTEAIRSPSLIVHNSAYHLYYARRRGTRWVIELATSEELLLWRPLGEVLGPSGVGFDSLGALGADARSLTDRIEMVYVGQDGVSLRLGRAIREAPSSTAPVVF